MVDENRCEKQSNCFILRSPVIRNKNACQSTEDNGFTKGWCREWNTMERQDGLRFLWSFEISAKWQNCKVYRLQKYQRGLRALGCVMGSRLLRWLVGYFMGFKSVLHLAEGIQLGSIPYGLAGRISFLSFWGLSLLRWLLRYNRVSPFLRFFLLYNRDSRVLNFLAGIWQVLRSALTDGI